MRILSLLIRTRMRAIWNLARGLKRESTLKIAVVSVLGTTFWGGLFFLFNEFFAYLHTHAFPFLNELIPCLLSLFFLVLIMMLVFSNALISFSNLFRSPETAFLFAAPVRHDTIYLYKLFESLVFSSWAFFALGVPLLLAYGIQFEAHWAFYPAVLIFFIPFVLIPAAVGSLLGLLITAIVPRHRGKILALLACAVLGAIIYLGIDLMNARHGRGGGGMGLGEFSSDVSKILGKLNFVMHPMSPNYWMTYGLLKSSEGTLPQLKNSSMFLLALYTSAAFFLALGWFVSGMIYAGSYSALTGSGPSRRRRLRSLVDFFAAPFKKRFPAITVLVTKDIKTFLRDPVQWSQVLIFFGLLTVYIANLRNFSYDLERPFYQNLISFLNLGATCLTLSTMVSRFVFPLISLEGQRFWVLGLVPVPRSRVLLAKFVFSLIGAILITESLVLLSNYILKNTGFILVVQVITAALVCVALTGLAVGMGALFPNFKESNPSKIVSGFGGTLTLILSITMVILTVMGEAFVCYHYVVQENALLPESDVHDTFKYVMALVLGAVALLSALVAYIPMRLGARALERVEF